MLRYGSNLNVHKQKKMWYVYTIEYYSAIKKSENLAFTTTQMDLEGIMLGEICQTEKDKYCMISLICGVQKLTQTRDYSKKETGLRYGEETGGYQ